MVRTSDNSSNPGMQVQHMIDSTLPCRACKRCTGLAPQTAAAHWPADPACTGLIPAIQVSKEVGSVCDVTTATDWAADPVSLDLT